MNTKKAAHSPDSPSVWRRVHEYLHGQVDGASLGVVRAGFGGLMLWDVLKSWSSFHIIYGRPDHLMTYEGFGWVRPLPGDWIHLPLGIAGVASLLLMVGLWYRFAIVVAFFSYTYWFLLDQSMYLNHFYLICMLAFMLIFMDANRWASLDKWRLGARLPDTVPRWNVLLLKLQIVIVYFYGGLAKLNPDWLVGEPLQNWLASRHDLPILGPIIEPDWVKLYVFVYGGLLLDLFVGFALLWRRTRVWALLPIGVFHLTNAYMFNIGVFPWMMLALTILFFEPGLPRVAWRALRRKLGKGESGIQQLAQAVATPRRLALASSAFFGVWLFAQITIPLRHFLDDSVVSWTEEGHRFAWHMKLRTKRAAGIFEVVDPATGRSERVEPVKLLGNRRARVILTRPRITHQFAQRLAADARANGVESPEVYAYIWASLNGRRHQPIVDASVDLASADCPLMSRPSWILPLDPNARVGEYPEFDPQIATWTMNKAALARR